MLGAGDNALSLSQFQKQSQCSEPEPSSGVGANPRARAGRRGQNGSRGKSTEHKIGGEGNVMVTVPVANVYMAMAISGLSIRLG